MRSKSFFLRGKNQGILEGSSIFSARNTHKTTEGAPLESPLDQLESLLEFLPVTLTLHLVKIRILFFSQFLDLHYFLCKAVWECILPLDKLIWREKILVNDCYLCKSGAWMYNHILFFGVCLHIVFGIWLTVFWVELGPCWQYEGGASGVKGHWKW